MSLYIVGTELTDMLMSLYRKAAVCLKCFQHILYFQYEPSVWSNIKMMPWEKNEIHVIIFQLYVFDHNYLDYVQYKHGVT